MTVPVRIDFSTNLQTAGAPIQTGLFGTAGIVVGEGTAVPIAPPAALGVREVSRRSATAAMLASASPRKPSVETREMSSAAKIFDVA